MTYQCEKLDLTPSRLRVYATAIKYGKGQAVTQKELAERWGVSDRAVRRIIAALRQNRIGDGVLIAGLQGYWMTENPVEIRAWVKYTKRKTRALQRITEGAEAVLRGLEGAEL